MSRSMRAVQSASAARATLAVVDGQHAAALAAQLAAQVAVDTAEQDDAVAPSRVRELRAAAEDAGTLAKRLGFKVDAARLDLHAAERQEAEGSFDDALPRAARSWLFAEVADAVLEVAKADGVPAVDIYDGDDDAIHAAMMAQYKRAVARARAARAIRAAVDAQHAACATVCKASAALGTPAPAIAPVPESHVFALVALETHALSDPAEVDEAFFTSWLSTVIAPRPGEHPVGEARRAVRGDIARMLDWARSVVRLGDVHQALAAITTRAAA